MQLLANQQRIFRVSPRDCETNKDRQMKLLHRDPSILAGGSVGLKSSAEIAAQPKALPPISTRRINLAAPAGPAIAEPAARNQDVAGVNGVD
jgi:hypothetical protein